MSATLTRRRARERDALQPTLFNQVLAPPARRDEERHDDVRRDDPPRDEAARDDVHIEATAVTTGIAVVDEPREDVGVSAQTLDDAISALWAQLSTGTEIDCPVCGSAMEPQHSAGAGVVGGRCTSCATTLA